MNWPTALVICFCAVCATICTIAITQKPESKKDKDDINY